MAREWHKSYEYDVVSTALAKTDPEGAVIARVSLRVDREIPAVGGPSRFPEGTSWNKIKEALNRTMEECADEVLGGGALLVRTS